MSDDDTRIGDRVPMELRVRLRYPDVETFIQKYAVNISRGGIFIASKAPQPVGSRIQFEFQLIEGQPVIKGEGDVAWIKAPDPAEPNRPSGMGVRFLYLEPESRALIDRAIVWKERKAAAAAAATAATATTAAAAAAATPPTTATSDAAEAVVPPATTSRPDPAPGATDGAARAVLGRMAIRPTLANALTNRAAALETPAPPADEFFRASRRVSPPSVANAEEEAPATATAASVSLDPTTTAAGGDAAGDLLDDDRLVEVWGITAAQLAATLDALHAAPPATDDAALTALVA